MSQADERRPGATERRSQKTAGRVASDTQSSDGSPARVLPMPLRWTRALIEGAEGAVPVYGSIEWRELPDDDRRKVAATCIAAEAWRLREYLEDLRQPRHGRRAREIAEARRPRPGDHPGGPVEWDGVASGD